MIEIQCVAQTGQLNVLKFYENCPGEALDVCYDWLDDNKGLPVLKMRIVSTVSYHTIHLASVCQCIARGVR